VTTANEKLPYQVGRTKSSQHKTNYLANGAGLLRLLDFSALFQYLGRLKMQPGEANFWTSDAQIPGAYSPGLPHFTQ
jgi:hypothetical protein